MHGHRALQRVSGGAVGSGYALFALMDAMVCADGKLSNCILSGRNADLLPGSAQQREPRGWLQLYLYLLRFVQVVAQDHRKLDLITLGKDFGRLMVYEERLKCAQLFLGDPHVSISG